ncbi:MAG: Gfo/Idh/MocA family oxidoreductase [Planctomycetota bacterium]
MPPRGGVRCGPPEERTSNWTGEKQMTLRWGLIGAGDIANKSVAPAIQADPKSELIAVCRRDEDLLADFADKFSIPRRYTTATQLLEDPDIDAVYLATPVDCHCSQAVAAARAGKHVLCEKPMAVDPDECTQMVEACEAAKVQLAVAYYRRFYPALGRIRAWIQEGRLGRVLSVGCVTGNPNRFPHDDWRVVQNRGGGGPLMDIGSHRLDLLLSLFGPADRVQASIGASPDYEAEETATLLIDFQGGVVGILQCYFGTINTPDRLEIIGTDGRIQIEDLNSGEVVFANGQVIEREDHPPTDIRHAPLIHDFSDAIKRQVAPAVTGRFAKQTNELIALAYAQKSIGS